MRIWVAIVVASVVLRVATARADEGDPFEPTTMVVQAGGGLAGAAGGVAVFGLVGLVVGLAIPSGDDWGKPLLVVAVAAAAGMCVGAVVGVKLTGDHYGATGGWAGSSLGFLGGAALAGLYATVLDKTDAHFNPQVRGLIGVTLVLGGTIAGYQIQNSGPDTTAERRVMIAIPAFTF